MILLDLNVVALVSYKVMAVALSALDARLPEVRDRADTIDSGKGDSESSPKLDKTEDPVVLSFSDRLRKFLIMPKVRDMANSAGGDVGTSGSIVGAKTSPPQKRIKILPPRF